MSVPSFLAGRLADLGGDVHALARALLAEKWHPRNVERVLGVVVAAPTKVLADGDASAAAAGVSCPEGDERTRQDASSSPDSPAADHLGHGPRALASAPEAPSSRRGDRAVSIATAPPRERPSGARLLGPIRKPDPATPADVDDESDEVDPHADTVPPSAPVVDLDERRRAMRRVDANDEPASREALRSRRTWATRPQTEATHRMSKRRLRLLGAGLDLGGERPLTRADCVGGPRPCPYVSCRHHLLLDVALNDHIKINFPHVFGADDEPDLELMVDTCSLDVADRDGVTLNSVAELMNITRERVRQIEASALEKVRRARSRRQGEAVSLAEHAS